MTATTEREHVLTMLSRRARVRAEDHSLTDPNALVMLLADHAAVHGTGGGGPARDGCPRYSYQCHRRGVWIGEHAFSHSGKGEPDITWREVADAALGIERPRQAVMPL